ncbi:CPBP family glutamic-type intramembrane protease [Bradyrhizobium sp. 2TAF24]|uniref:CPBP family glutamic-type intramembrane protease n=1 Tax=Bradyrhizobium sp. 2TAF24 TaxID=3233011 RepID=UPI003F939A8A
MITARTSLFVDLHLMPAAGRRAAAAVAAIAAAAVVAAIAVAADTAFRSQLAADYVAHYTSALMPRMAFMVLTSAYEEVKWRLVLMTLLIAATRLVLGRRPPDAAFIAVIAFVQFCNVADGLAAAPVYAAFRFFLPGCVWGWLYWRHGWVTALAAHAACHLIMDPVLRIVLS